MNASCVLGGGGMWYCRLQVANCKKNNETKSPGPKRICPRAKQHLAARKLSS